MKIETTEYNILTKLGKKEKIDKFHNTVVLLNYNNKSYVLYMNIYFKEVFEKEAPLIKSMFNDKLKIEEKEIIIKKVKFFKEKLEETEYQQNKEDLFNRILKLNIDFYDKQEFKKELFDFLEEVDKKTKEKIIKYYEVKTTKTIKNIKIELN